MLHLDADGLFFVFDELPVEAAGAPANREERRFIPAIRHCQGLHSIETAKTAPVNFAKEVKRLQNACSLPCPGLLREPGKKICSMRRVRCDVCNPW